MWGYQSHQRMQTAPYKKKTNLVTSFPVFECTYVFANASNFMDHGRQFLLTLCRSRMPKITITIQAKTLITKDLLSLEVMHIMQL
jgi:hypothetical protein